MATRRWREYSERRGGGRQIAENFTFAPRPGEGGQDPACDSVTFSCPSAGVCCGPVIGAFSAELISRVLMQNLGGTGKERHRRNQGDWALTESFRDGVCVI